MSDDGAVSPSVPGRPTNTDSNRKRIYTALALGAGGGSLDFFFSPQSYHFSFSLPLADGSM